MIVIGLIQQVSTDAELKALTGISRNALVYHNGDNSVYIYEPKFGNGDVISDDGGYWIKDNIEALDLAGYKSVRYNEIDERTGELITQGFAYKGLVFSLSQNAQINILGMDEVRDDPAMTYPVEYSTIDDSAHYTVTDSVDLHTMYLTALGTKKSWVDSGTILKDSIRSTVNESEVELIIDNR